MKVFAISSAQIPEYNNRINNNKINDNYSKKCHSADIMRAMSKMSANNIYFGSSDFDRTVQANYFKLPAGAKPDVFQKAAAQNILLDNDVLVTAPTGTGKTAIAHYAIGKNLRDGKKTFYTTPLKALSNEKYRDFKRIYGEENVGILTGDTKINGEAPIVIMTTEVYRNMVFGEHFGKKNDLLDDLKTVIFDELHYLGDVDRGGIWEQSIFLSRPETQLLSLSATIGNNKDIAGWMAKIRGEKNPEIVTGSNKELAKYKANEHLPVHTVLIDVPPENRHVPLEFENINVSDLNLPDTGKKKSKFSAQIDKLNQLAEKKGIIPAYAYRDVVVKLKDEDKLPAIFFVFDKKNSKDILEYLTKYGPHLTSDDEKEQIMDIVEGYEADGKYLGESLNMRAILKGYAVHNAGLLPTQKELVEELFQKKLVKTVIATETLSAGINMPTRTTVITATRKPSSTPDGPDNKRTISANEFHQMAGRAGRRGIDKVGYCYTMSLNDDERSQFDMLVHSQPNKLKSAFRPDFSFIAKYYEECQNDTMLNLLYEKSFFTYNKNEQIEKKNKENLKALFNRKITLMRDFGYLSTTNRLTNKGILISDLNGYEQIPIIEMLTEIKAFDGMSPSEIAGAVGALANIELKKDGQFGSKTFDVKPKGYDWANSNIEQFTSKLNSCLSVYNSYMTRSDKTFHQIQINDELTNNIYLWAEMNSIENSDSTQNWSKLYYNADKRKYKDEGSMFKGIMMTIDLLKQIKTTAEHGAAISNTNADYEYYTGIVAKIDKAIDLINREPASNM
ncbi:DEAD/DEAH box helicase [bacterium]|nr:DEAD/DEAH box helicase [bacterium]